MLALSTDFGAVLTGFVLPFPIIMTELAGAVFTQFILNPRILHPLDVLHQWRPGLDVRGTGSIQWSRFLDQLWDGKIVQLRVCWYGSLYSDVAKV